jgi:THO complex subunit 1
LQEKWVTSTRNKIAGYLQEGPEGKFYYRMVDTVLSRDKNWVRWKLESCPPIVRDAVTPEENTEAKAGARQATINKRLKTKPMGSIDVTFLAEVDNAKGLEALKDASRYVQKQHMWVSPKIDADLSLQQVYGTLDREARQGD